MKLIPILLGITGSIAAYKTPDLIRRLKEQGYFVRVVLTQGGKAFVTTLSLQAVSQHPVYEHLMDTEAEAAMSHIGLARWPQAILIAPASAHFIAKLANGLADDLLSTLCLASTAPILLVPAMNRVMWSHPATQDNVNRLKERGCFILGPTEGDQACGETGLGRMLEPLEIVRRLSEMFKKPHLQGANILITAGPTQEWIDPVRYLSNRSSGKMGFALAQAALDKGACVTLISGPVALTPPKGCRFIAIRTAAEMLNVVQAEIIGHTFFISAAAVADYRPVCFTPQKIKKSTLPITLSLQPTTDILATIRKMNLNPRPFIVGFAAETEQIIQSAQEKLLRKGVDLMVVNDVSQSGIGFDSDENEVTVLSSDVPPICLMRAPKQRIAEQLLQITLQKASKRGIVLRSLT